MSILNDKQIQQKIRRLSYEIIEQNTDVKDLYLAGINNNGYRFASLLKESLEDIRQCPFDCHLIRARLNPAKPVEGEISLDVEAGLLKNKTVILIDDVANTGRTLFYAFKPFLDLMIRKMQVVVMVDRKHKSFPVKVDYVGMSLATTLKDNIEVKLKPKRRFRVEIT